MAQTALSLGTVTGQSAANAENWSNPDAVLVKDGTYASVTLPAGRGSQDLLVTGFGFNIPIDATISNVEFVVRYYSSANVTTAPLRVYLNLGSANNYWSNNATTTVTDFTFTPSLESFNASSSTVTPAFVNSPDFGLDIYSYNSGGSSVTHYIDSVEVRVYYYNAVSTTEWRSPTLAAQTLGTINWSVTDTSASTSDDIRATIAPSTTASQNRYLDLFGFGFNIPADSAVVRVEANIERMSSGTGTVRDDNVSLTYNVNHGFLSQNNLGLTTTNWPTTEAVATYGVTPVFSLYHTKPNIINDTYFGISIRPVAFSGTPTAQIDHAQLRVAYGEYIPGLITGYTNSGTGTQNYSMEWGGVVTTEFRYPTVGESSGGTVAWVNPGNVVASDDTYATLTLSGTGNTTPSKFAFLNAKGFGFNIPTGSSILGLRVRVEYVQTGGTTGGLVFDSAGSRYIKNGAAAGAFIPLAAPPFPTTETTTTFGNRNSTYDATYTAEDVNEANFGFALRVAGSTTTSNRTANIDSIAIEVTYAPPPPSSIELLGYTNSGSSAQAYVIKWDGLVYVELTVHPNTRALQVTPDGNTGWGNPSVANIFDQAPYTDPTAPTRLNPAYPAQSEAGTPWQNISNVFQPDGNYATFTFKPSIITVPNNGNEFSDAPTLMGWSYPSMPPSDATITGVEVSFKGYRTGPVGGLQMNLFKHGLGTGGRKESYNLTTTDQTLVYGGPNDRWPLGSSQVISSWTPSDVVSSTGTSGNITRMQFYAWSNQNGSQVHVDSIQLRWHWINDPSQKYSLSTTVGPVTGTQSSNLAQGTVAWTGVGTGGGTQVPSTTSTDNGFLVVSGFDFSTLPQNISITGVRADVMRYSSGGTTGTIRDSNVAIVKAGTGSIWPRVQGWTLHTSADWPTGTAGLASYGAGTGQNALWGTTFTRNDIADPGFGVRLGAVNTGTGANRTANVQSVAVTIYYEEANVGSGVGTFWWGGWGAS